MDLTYLIKGLIIGFVLPIPIGPAGILCIRRTIVQGKLHGFLTGLSAALSDMIYGIIAAFGISLVSTFVYDHQNEIRIVGGIILFVLGYYTFRPLSTVELEKHLVFSPALSFFSTFLVTFTNPMTVFAFAAIFAAVGAVDLTNHYDSKVMLVAGVFFGSLGWYSLLTLLSNNLKITFSSHRVTLVNRITGSLLMLFGIIALVMGLGKFVQ